ncbi:hypothetical protein [Streptomyces aurantiogriseus]|nr:hypothetical protein [Streptomyces aurantiogriseus]
MTHHDITFLLAEAADEVEIGTAPTQALIRGGRRRRARRWAVAAAAALVVAGSTGALAVGGLPGGEDRGTSVSARPGVLAPQRTLLAEGVDHGQEWRLTIDVWAPPRDDEEAREQLAAMAELDEKPLDVREASSLVGKLSFFVKHTYGELQTGISQMTVETARDVFTGTDRDWGESSLNPSTDELDRPLVIGRAARTAEQVTCTWQDGSTTEARTPSKQSTGGDESVLRHPAGLPYAFFVCVGPEEVRLKSAEVTK